MRLIDLVQSSPWAILPEKLDAIHQVLYNRVHGIKIDTVSLEASLGRALEGSVESWVTPEGVAVIPMNGIMARFMNLFMAISGGVSTELVMKDVKSALADPEVQAIVLSIDSPGGTLSGTEALSEAVFAGRAVKPIVAVCGQMCSAAYWVGSSADRVIAEHTGDVGSIGVFMAHYDYSRADEMEGVKRTLIYAGKYKVVGNDTEPLDKASKDILQERVDYFYSVFVNMVARNRGVSVETALKDMAEGKVFTGEQALQAGLIDGLGGLDAAISLALELCNERRKNSMAALGAGKENKTMFNKIGNQKLTLEALQADQPDLFKQVFDQGAASVDQAAISLQASQGEKKRVLDLVSVHFGEEEGAAFATVVESGITVEQLKAVKGAKSPALGAKGKQEMLSAIQNAGPGNPGAGGGSQEHGQRDFLSQVEAYRFQHKCGKTEAMKAVSAQDPKAHEAWIKSKQKAQG